MYVTLKYLLSLYGKLIIFSCIIYTLVVLVDRIVLFHCSNIDLLDCWKLVLRYLVILGRAITSLEVGMIPFDSLVLCGGQRGRGQARGKGERDLHRPFRRRGMKGQGTQP